MSPLQKIIEEKIAEAMKNGEFDNLPGRGQPLDLEDDAHVPPELRMAYRMLKRANIPPEEVLMHKNASAMRLLLADPDLTDEERKQIKRRLMMVDLEISMRLEKFRKQYGGF